MKIKISHILVYKVWIVYVVWNENWVQAFMLQYFWIYIIEVEALTLGGDVFLSKKDNHIWALTATFNSFIFVFLFGIRRCVKVFSSILGHTYTQPSCTQGRSKFKAWSIEYQSSVWETHNVKLFSYKSTRKTSSSGKNFLYLKTEKSSTFLLLLSSKLFMHQVIGTKRFNWICQMRKSWIEILKKVLNKNRVFSRWIRYIHK